MIVFESVTKIYDPNVVALRDTSFVIEKGEFVFLVGPSGSGKSTIMRLLLKELDPTRGRILVGGRELARLKGSKVPMLRRNLGCVFQDFKLLTDRTAYENVAYALKVQGDSKSQIRGKVPEIMALVGLGAKMNNYPHELSGGEQQRVSIARAFVNHPPLLICDEPTGNLDPDTSVGIMQLLYRINRTGTTVVMATHDREMVDKMRKRVIALEDGVVMRAATRRRTAKRAVTGVDRTRQHGGTVRARLFFTEAFRSIAANLSTSVAAVMTVLIGMFLLGLFIALGTWVISWTDHVKKDLVVNVYFCTDLTCGQEATPQQIESVRAGLANNPDVDSIEFISKEKALEEMEKRFPDLAGNLARNPLPPAYKVIPIDAERVKTIAGTLDPPPTGRREGDVRREESGARAPGGDDHRRDLPRREHHPPDRLDHPDRQHDSPLDLLAAARDRGDEARRRLELVRARPVHARGHPLRPGRIRPRGHPSPDGQGARAPRHHGQGRKPGRHQRVELPGRGPHPRRNEPGRGGRGLGHHAAAIPADLTAVLAVGPARRTAGGL